MGQCNSTQPGQAQTPAPSAILAPASVDPEAMQKAMMAQSAQREERLKNMRCFVLDNTLRETTVAAIKGHTIEEKDRILTLIRNCGIKDIIVAYFTDSYMVDDQFAIDMVKRHGPEHLFAFSEFVVKKPGLKFDEMSTALPVGLEKCRRYGLCNVILELNFCDVYKWLTPEGVEALFLERLQFIHSELAAGARVLVNYRDFVPAMKKQRSHVMRLTTFLGGLPPDVRPLGLIFEDPAGSALPITLSTNAGALKATMVKAGWGGAELLVHVHCGFGLADACVLGCLAAGATGIWCAICKEGGGVGHACSITALANLARHGNAWVSKDFNMQEMRKAAIEVTRIITGADPHPQTEVYGARAMDKLWAADGMGTSDFSLAALFKEPEIVRMSTFTTPEMVQARLQYTFIDHTKPAGDIEARWPLEICAAMKEIMRLDLLFGRRLSYNTVSGLLFLWERAGGVVTPEMEERAVSQESLLHSKALVRFHDFFAAHADQFVSGEQKLSNKSSRPAAKMTDSTVTTRTSEGQVCVGASSAATSPRRLMPLRTLGLLVILGRSAARKRRIQARAAVSSDAGTRVQADAMRTDTSAMAYDIFFKLFLAREIDTHPSRESELVFKILDPKSRGAVSWFELLPHVLWSVEQLPERTKTIEGLVDVLCKKMLLPEAMDPANTSSCTR